VAQVATVKGPISTSELGTMLMHEHIFVLSPEIEANYPSGWDEDARVAQAVDRLNQLKAAGIDSIADPTVVGLGRHIPRIQRIAEQTELNIVVATGLYTFDALPHYFDDRGPGTMFGGDDPMVEMFVGDITEGIAGTGVRAAFLKCATDRQGVTPGVERVLRAVAKAHLATGAPILTHTNAGSHQGAQQQRIFAEEGVDLSRVVIGHCGDTTDLDYLEELIGRGSFVAMDRFGLDFILPFEDRVATVVALCERGYADHVVLAHDACCFIDWFPDEAMAVVAPNWHYLHITNDVLPALRERGVTEAQIEQMLVANPRNYFETAGTY
jgi:phosphotriesterase-related protein